MLIFSIRYKMGKNQRKTKNGPDKLVQISLKCLMHIRYEVERLGWVFEFGWHHSFLNVDADKGCT